MMQIGPPSSGRLGARRVILTPGTQVASYASWADVLTSDELAALGAAASDWDSPVFAATQCNLRT